MSGGRWKWTELVQELTYAGKEVVLSLDPVPRELAMTLDEVGQGPMAIFEHPVDRWLGYVVPVLMRHGQIVRQWQMGSVRDAELFYLPDLEARVARVREVFEDWAPMPALALPWRLDQSSRRLDPTLVYAMDVPEGVAPRSVSQYLEEWVESRSGGVWLHMRVLPADVLTHEKRVEDMALRVLYAWEAGGGTGGDR